MTPLIQTLQNPELYDHPIEKFEVVETHISLVLLTGSYVYKIKKPVNFGFLDFSTLEKRRHYCEEELRLNSRLAPHLYVDIVAITGSVDHPQLNGSGQVVEYAVRMRQFPQRAQLDLMLAAGQLGGDIIDRLADRVAMFHLEIDATEANQYFGDFDHIRQPMTENFSQISDAVKDPSQKTGLDEIERWTLQQLDSLMPLIRLRKDQGFVRECHGDMHLRNIAWWHNEIVIFDCIEFNPNLYWIDVMSEIAFLVMDLEDRQQNQLAQRFLNRYLEITGDYEGLKLLRMYKVYRALVRAKVEALRSVQEQAGSEEYKQSMQVFRQYLDLATGYLKPIQPLLIINFGLSGAGKSFISRQLAELLPAIQLRSDVERKRIYNIAATEQSSQEQQRWLYSREATDKTYARLLAIATVLLDGGYSVVIDAANLKKIARQTFVELAQAKQVPYLILAFEAEKGILSERIEHRVHKGEDASDATLAVLEQQILTMEALTQEELEHAIVLDTGAKLDIDGLCKQIQYAYSANTNCSSL